MSSSAVRGAVRRVEKPDMYAPARWRQLLLLLLLLGWWWGAATSATCTCGIQMSSSAVRGAVRRVQKPYLQAPAQRQLLLLLGWQEEAATWATCTCSTQKRSSAVTAAADRLKDLSLLEAKHPCLCPEAAHAAAAEVLEGSRRLGHVWGLTANLLPQWAAATL
jgi:hypothetical protein